MKPSRFWTGTGTGDCRLTTLYSPEVETAVCAFSAILIMALLYISHILLLMYLRVRRITVAVFSLSGDLKKYIASDASHLFRFCNCKDAAMTLAAAEVVNCCSVGRMEQSDVDGLLVEVEL